ncbi:MAG TPA: ribosomal protein L7/L12 [Reyranella sp.]|nr:ribosomal protein L7/L12 [Reyranella sp.]
MRVPFLIAAAAAVLLAACGPQGPSDADIMAGNIPGENGESPQQPATPAPTPVGPYGSNSQPGMPVTYGLSVVITNVGDRKISVIQAVQAARPGMGLAEAKTLVETPNAVVASGLSAADATALQNSLQAAGATVSVQ